MEIYQNNINQYCSVDPILDKVIKTGDGPIFTVVIKLHQSIYTDKEKYLYWYFKCTKNSVPLEDCDLCSVFHPFKYIEDGMTDQTVEFWNIIADNDLVRTVINYIAMSDEELSKLCGNIHVVEYRSQLIRFIYNIWD